jgi:hypothetical protein
MNHIFFPGKNEIARRLSCTAFLLLALNVLPVSAYGQCGMISGTSDRKTGEVSKGGLVTSWHFYSLLIRKTVPVRDSFSYSLFLNAASRVMLPDSLLQAKGTFRLFLADGSEIILENATCTNNPLGMGGSIGFDVKTTRAVMLQVLRSPIARIRVFEILETPFKERMQKKQQKIIQCLETAL